MSPLRIQVTAPRAVAVLACVAALILMLLPTPEGMDPRVLRTAGMIVFAIGLWSTAVVPEYFSTIVFFFLAVVLNVAPPEVVFSGFHSGAVWIVFGGLVIGAAVSETGLGGRIASALVGRFGTGYFGVIAGIVFVAALLSFLMPSTAGRVVVLLPIVLALADRMGFQPGSAGRAGMAMAVAAGTLHPALGVLPATVPSLALMGAAESIHGIRLSYMEYFVAEFPVIGLVSLVVLPGLIWAMFRDTPRPAGVEGPAGPATAAQRKLLIILLLALALWMTDFLHGIQPAWVGLGAAVVCLMPRYGAVPPGQVMERFNIGPWFYVTGIIGMGAMVTSSGLGNAIGGYVFGAIALTPGQDFLNMVVVTFIGMVAALVAAIPGQPAIMAALMPNIAEATGWPMMTVMKVLPAAWGMGLFAFQYPPMVLAMHLAGVRAGQIARVLLAMTVVSWLVIVPLQYLWLRYLGMFG